jgi:hypothetical protein
MNEYLNSGQNHEINLRHKYHNFDGIKEFALYCQHIYD